MHTLYQIATMLTIILWFFAKTQMRLLCEIISLLININYEEKIRQSIGIYVMDSACSMFDNTFKLPFRKE